MIFKTKLEINERNPTLVAEPDSSCPPIRSQQKRERTRRKWEQWSESATMHCHRNADWLRIVNGVSSVSGRVHCCGGADLGAAVSEQWAFLRSVWGWHCCCRGLLKRGRGLLSSASSQWERRLAGRMLRLFRFLAPPLSSSALAVRFPFLSRFFFYSL